jgi:hypothetical protein
MDLGDLQADERGDDQLAQLDERLEWMDRNRRAVWRRR